MMKNLIKATFAMLIISASGFTACSDDGVNCTESTWYQDADSDGLGNPDVSVKACDQPEGYVSNNTDEDDNDNGSGSVYTGTASVSQGLGVTTTENLFSRGVRVAGVGSVVATDGSTWTVPAEVNFTDNNFPFASDLHNIYGNTYNSAEEAVNALDGSDIITVDDDGEVITGYIFADNYFELYINGVAVGKDAVPFTEFNSSIVRFRVSRPFTIAMKLVDWEENLGLGSESNNGSGFHPGDGGMVAVFKDASDAVIALTGSDWKAQTYYTAPVTDLSCPTENGTTRLSDNCSTSDSNDGTSYYALHWELPSNWYEEAFDDSTWPDA
ncbi:MAG: hypothetical protein WBA74_20020, partial [Cyclobacteriaceae bacterium]